MTQEKALEYMRKGNNIFLTGSAGTGKTYTINKYIKESEDKGLKVLITASTGIAALNLSNFNNENSCRIGKTLHTAFAIPIPAYGKYEKDIKLSKIPKETKEADIIIIDEISMCRNDVFTFFYFTLEKIKKQYKKNPQVIVIGDFYQLPPVVKEEEKSKLKRLGFDPSGYCFYTPEWNKMKFKFCELDEVYRQNDYEFIENLRKLRIGDISCIDYFNERFTTNYPTDCMLIASTNAEVDRINETFLSNLPGARAAYVSTRKGRTAKEYTTDDIFYCKPGAKVMFMVNDVINNEYQNGTIGVVKNCYDNSVVVEVNGRTIIVKEYEWKTFDISIKNGILNKKEIGSYKQLPLKLAYAITMHKTQGQTYDRAVIEPNSFTDGQLYVAMSRVKDINGLYLVEPIEEDFIRVNPLVKEFYENKKIEIPKNITDKRKELETKYKDNKKKPTKKTTPIKNKTNKKSSSTKKTNTKTKKEITKKSDPRKSTKTKKTTRK